MHKTNSFIGNTAGGRRVANYYDYYDEDYRLITPAKVVSWYDDTDGFLLPSNQDKAKEIYLNKHKNIVDISGRIIMNSEKNEIFNFGKYKNQLVSKVFKTNPEYYHWIMKSDFPQHTKKKFTEIKLRDIN